MPPTEPGSDVVSVAAAVVSLIAGILTIVLRVRELRSGYVSPSDNERGRGLVLDASGHAVLVRAVIRKPSMIVPALGFTFLVEAMAAIGGGVSAPVVDSALKEAHRDQHASPDKTNEGLGNVDRSFIVGILNTIQGSMILGTSFPVFVFICYRRAFQSPGDAFGRAAAMGFWAGLGTGSAELLLAYYQGLAAGEHFFSKFLQFLLFGVLTGVLFVVWRAALESSVVRSLIRNRK
jgi:hypothetical protein